MEDSMKPDVRPRIIYNDDNCSLARLPHPRSVEQVSLATDYLRGTQVDWLCWFVASNIAYSYPSKVLDTLYDLFERREFGIGEPDKLPLFLHGQGIDYLPILIEQTHQAGMRFFASFRMNDGHHKSSPSGVLAGDFWRLHQHYRLWEVVDGYTYYNGLLDYSYTEVRKRYLDAVAEVAAWYDVDGVELDFCRNPYLFQPSEAWSKRHILTRFIKQVRDRLERIGRSKGRKLRLIVRTVFCEAAQRRGGMDVRAWIRDRLPDVLVMSDLTNNLNRTVEPWASSCRATGVLFYPSTESGPAIMNDRHTRVRVPNPVASPHNHVVFQTAEEYVLRQRAMAQNFLAQGVDGLYMFNYPTVLHENAENRFTAPSKFRKKAAVLSELGRLKTLQSKPKQFTFWEDLPLQVESARPPEYYQTIRFQIRDSMVRHKETTVRLRFRQTTERNPHAPGLYRQDPYMPRGHMRYLLNGKEPGPRAIRRRKQPEGKIPSGFTLGPHEQVTITVPGRSLTCGQNTLAFYVPGFPKERDPYIHIYELTVDVS